MAKKQDESIERRCMKCRSMVIDVEGPLGDMLTVNAKTVKMYAIGIPDPRNGKWVARVIYVHAKHEC